MKGYNPFIFNPQRREYGKRIFDSPSLVSFISARCAPRIFVL